MMYYVCMMFIVEYFKNNDTIYFWISLTENWEKQRLIYIRIIISKPNLYDNYYYAKIICESFVGIARTEILKFLS